MEIRDVIHGSIGISPEELPVIDSSYFQRLRQIKQLGFAEYTFPSATHNRYIHSLGTLQTATQAFDRIFKSSPISPRLLPSLLPPLLKDDFNAFRALVRLAALLHDIGHGPLSHTSEFAMPPLSKLGLPLYEQKDEREPSRNATHEDYTLKIILDSPLTPQLEKLGQRSGFKPIHIAALVDSHVPVRDDFFLRDLEGTKVNFRPILHQLISSELDADRMDYLRRDSLHAGVSYGQFDFDWLVGNLTYTIQNKGAYLCLEHRALYAFEDFLISRFHMFLMVYFHYKSVVFDEMLSQYLKSKDCSYFLPSDIEKYIDYNDSHLHTHLSQNKNPWAKRISDKRPYRVLVELHSGIPATKSSDLEQKELLEQTLKKLEEKDTPYLKVTSTSELSKYFKTVKDPIFVRYDNHLHPPHFIPLEECTDLFEKYSKNRTITRIYVAPENITQLRDSML